MTENLTKTKYLVDTNVLFGFSLWKPMSLNINKEFWSKFSDVLRDGKWTLLNVVVKEVLYDRELLNWCKTQEKRGTVTKIQDCHKNRAIEINAQYEMIDHFTGKSEVDTYLIAYAEANNLGIFSRESRRKNSKDLYKIPDVCDLLRITNINKPKIFLQEIGFN